MDSVVELSRAGCETLQFRTTEIKLQTVANVFGVSFARWLGGQEFLASSKHGTGGIRHQHTKWPRKTNQPFCQSA